MLPGNLDKKGHDVEVVSFFRDKKGTQLYLKETNIRFHFLDAFSISIPNLVKEFPYFISLVKVIEEIQPDIMHINNLPFLTTLQSTRLAKKMGIPSIVHVHGVMAKSNKLIDLAQSLYIRTLGQQIFNDATLVICLTRSDAYEIQRYMCPAEKIRIVPNGVDVETFKPYSSVMDNLLFWGGRFVFQKGLIYLIHAFANVVNSNPDIKLRMTGDGPLLSKIYAMVKSYGLENNVEFKGRVPRDELSKLIGESSIYLLPSLKEGMPYALLEAMACGKPVIGSDIPGINDVITHGKNGILVPPRNPEALANAILTILDDKGLRIKLGQNARQLMVEKYSWDTISEKIEKIYHEAIEERK
jgi:glycosyltransferase involved in cell wall biosynthesis